MLQKTSVPPFLCERVTVKSAGPTGTAAEVRGHRRALFPEQGGILGSPGGVELEHRPSQSGRTWGPW